MPTQTDSTPAPTSTQPEQTSTQSEPRVLHSMGDDETWDSGWVWA